MRRTIDLTVEIEDDDAYADVIAAIYLAVETKGRVQDIKFTSTSTAINARVERQVPDLKLKHGSGSVHDKR